MPMLRSWVGFALIAGASSLVVPAIGCKKDEKKDGEKSEKATKDEDGDKKKKGDSSKYTSGELLKHLPTDCAGGRVYFNVGLFLKNEAVEKSAEALEDKFSESKSKKDKKFAKAMKSLKKSGIDPARDVKEVAICLVAGLKTATIAIGGNFADKDPVEAIATAANEAGDKELEKKKSDGVSYVKDGKDFFAQVAPNVLVITESKADFADLKTGEGSDSGWNLDKGRILAFNVTDKKNGKFVGSITESGDDLDLKLTVDFAGPTGDKIEDDPQQFKKGMEAMRDKLEAKLKKGPFKKIADDIGNAKFKVDGSKVTVTLTVPSSDLGEAVKKAASLEEEELETAVDL